MRPLPLSMLALVLALAAAPASADRPSDLNFVYLRDSDNTIMSGSLTDLERIRKQFKPGERLLWFRMPDTKEFVIRDPATLDRFDAIWKPANALAAQQGQLGGRQGVLGAKQGVLGSRQGMLGMRQGALAREQAELDARDRAATTEAERHAIAKERRALDAELRDVAKRMRELSDAMRQLEKPMRELSDEMSVLQKKHDAAHRVAQGDSAALLGRAIQSGLAKPL